VSLEDKPAPPPQKAEDRLMEMETPGRDSAERRHATSADLI
jgi:hypothetical protein